MATTHKFGVKDAVGEVKEGGGGGQTPRPDEGAYKGTLIQLKLTKNGSGDPMLKAIVKLENLPKKQKASEGYWVWNNLNLTDQGKGYVNAFLNALAGSEKEGLKLQRDLWEKGLLSTKDKDGGDVLAIGKFKIGSPDGKRKMGVEITHRTYTNRDGEEVDTVNVARYLPAAGGSDDDDDLVDDDDLDDDDVDSDSDDDSDDDLDERDELKEELEELDGDIKALRKKARDEFEIAASETKEKSAEEIIELILEAFDADGDDDAEGSDDDDLDDDEDEEEEEEKPKAKKKKAGKGKPPF